MDLQVLNERKNTTFDFVSQMQSLNRGIVNKSNYTCFTLGMMPLYLWVGNPFCFPCIPLRVVAFLPAGLIAMVMTFAPIMGFAKNRLLPFAPKELQDEIGEVANTFWMIGLIFWVILGSVLFFSVCVWYHYCREEDEESSCCLCPCQKKQSETLLRN